MIKSPFFERLLAKGISPHLAILALAFLYGAVLAGLPVDAFKDRVNYLSYAENSHIIIARYWDQGVLSLLSNEPLWLLTNVILRTVMPAEYVVRTLIFVPAFAVAFVVLRQSPKQFVWLIMFLIMAQVMKNHIIHLRQGYAIAIFLIGWFSLRREVRWPLMVASAFVHTSFAFVLLLLIALRVARLANFSPIVQVAGSAIFGGFVGFALPVLVRLLGARQANEYDFSSVSVSGLGFVFWALIFLLMVSDGRSYIRNHTFSLSSLAFYLANYFQVEVIARIFESTLLILLLSGLRLSEWRRNIFLIMITFYVFFQYFQQFDQPYLGWGI